MRCAQKPMGTPTSKAIHDAQARQCVGVPGVRGDGWRGAGVVGGDAGWCLDIGNDGEMVIRDTMDLHKIIAVKNWDAVDRRHANPKAYGRRPTWWKPWQYENATRPRKDKVLNRIARRAGKREVEMEWREAA